MADPIIGLTTYGRSEINLQTKFYWEWFAIPTLYVDAVRRAGGVPVLLPPGEENFAAVLNAVDAMILIGGSDIDPERYGGDNNHPQVQRHDPERDASELELIRRLANERRLPTLCICRGMQAANVAMGGTLHEHLPDVVAEDIHRSADQGWTVQPLQAQADSLLAAIMGSTEVATYSGHHQALKDLGKGLRVAATAEDGVIEAIELEGHPWFVCVQWHPEMSAATDATQQRIFTALVQEARKSKNGRVSSAPAVNSHADSG